MRRRAVPDGHDRPLAGAGLPGARAGGGRRRPAATSWAVGDFILTRRGRVLAVAHGSEPGRVLWETDPQGDFLVAERPPSATG